MNDSIFCIYKPYGISSAKFLNTVKHKLNVKKIGFAGTLDPLAEGVLVVATGSKTKALHDITNYDKEYLFEMEFGKQTTTGDAEGEIIKTSDIIPNSEDIAKCIKNNFTGTILQTPHLYSALKHKGERLCDLARNNANIDHIVEQKQREIIIHQISLLNFDYNKKTATIKVLCSKGTYVRKLSEDIAKNFGSVAFTKKIIRTAVGEYTVDKCISF